MVSLRQVKVDERRCGTGCRGMGDFPIEVEPLEPLWWGQLEERHGVGWTGVSKGIRHRQACTQCRYMCSRGCVSGGWERPGADSALNPNNARWLVGGRWKAA